ncbi:hypothetical protein ACEN2J_09050 [Pseudorhodobacter sp. W20_MBD10_FR17]|uniref:hypothetical protein n=1 Tax=Pseudorhodobacter sp. W20_MBD10_FR17 TaxID=3240266 RepID=UPI003F9A36FE
MKAFLILFFVWFATASNSQTVVVRSGEHDGFTRLVASWPSNKEWRLFRTREGYDLVIDSKDVQYDLADAFKRITKRRIAEMNAQADTLHIMLSCECYAAPIALQAGVLVVDIVDGSPPDGSAFELDRDGRTAAPLSSLEIAPETTRTTDNPEEKQLSTDVASAIKNAARHTPSLPPTRILAAEPSLDHVRNELLLQLSKGVAAGVVDAVDKIKSDEQDREGHALEKNIRIKREMGLVAGASRPSEDEMTAAGNACIPDDKLNIGNWADPSNVAAEFANNTTGLVGEFDHPEADAISRAMRYYLSLGFGAEARQIASGFKSSPAQRALLETLSYIIDLEIPPGSEFAGMENCDTNAAIWAVLAKQELKPLNHIAIPAMLRAFSAFPTHLRRQLGPGLAERFLAAEDYPTAMAVRDAMMRTAQENDPPQAMLNARIQLAEGDIASAEVQLSQLAGASTPTGIAATIALIETHVNEGREVTLDLAVTAEALLKEAQGGTNETGLREALALAYASQDRFIDAFKQVDKYDPKAKQVWEVLANHGSNDAILTIATLQAEQEKPQITDQTRQKISRRLLDLGFPDKALLWLEAGSERNDEGLVLAAEAQLLLGNNLEVLSLLEGQENENSNKLRARALAKMQTADAVDQLAQSGQENEASIAARQKRDWPELMTLNESGIWRDAAALTEASPKVDVSTTTAQTAQQSESEVKGPLARTRDTLAESEKARAVLNQLLSSQHVPN